MITMLDTLAPALLLRLSAVQSPSGLFSLAAIAMLTVVVLCTAAFAPRDEQIIPAYEVFGMSKGDTFSEARQRYATSSRRILEEGLTEVRH